MNEIEFEKKKCKEDIFYFVDNYCKYKGEKISLSSYQYDFLNALSKDDKKFEPDLFTIDNPHSGKSITLSIYVLWKCLFYNNMNIAFSTQPHCFFGARNNIETMKDIYFNLPEFLQDVGSFFDRNEISFSNGSKIFICVDFRRQMNKVDILIFDSIGFVSLNPRVLSAFFDERTHREIVYHMNYDNSHWQIITA